MISASDLMVLLGNPKAPRNLKPEDKICYEFAIMCRALTYEGKLKAVWCHIPNEYSGVHRPVWGALKSALGRIAGAPDYVFLWEKGCGFIEFKSEKGIQSPSQKKFQKWCLKNDVPYELSRSAAEGEEILKKWGLI